MQARELKILLSDDNIKLIMSRLGGIIWYEDEEKIIYNNICHDSKSINKLYYYKRCTFNDYNSENNFHCYTECGQIDILHIVQYVKDYTLQEAINYIQVLLGIEDFPEGFKRTPAVLINDWDFINSYERNYKRVTKTAEELVPLDPKLLNTFQNIYRSEWIDEGISKDIMRAFNIKYSTLRQSIVIPHYDINNNLVGIRQRAMLDFDIENYGKYTPFRYGNTMYNHKLNLNLYGINMNKDAIKRKKKVMLVESEKSVLQSASMFGIDENFTLALCGCSQLSNEQIDLLIELEVNEVIIGLDRQYEIVDSKEYNDWIKHIKEKIINPLLVYFNVSILWDTTGLLGYKDSPTDRGKEVLLQLMENKLRMYS